MCVCVCVWQEVTKLIRERGIKFSEPEYVNLLKLKCKSEKGVKEDAVLNDLIDALRDAPRRWPACLRVTENVSWNIRWLQCHIEFSDTIKLTAEDFETGSLFSIVY